MERQSFQFKLKAAPDEAGAFQGWASTYGNVDLGGDICAPGCFAQSIRMQAQGYPVLWQHRQDEPIGIGRISDASKGLQIDGQLVLADPVAQRAYEFMKASVVRGLSIGFETIKADSTPEGNRVLREVKLFEISLVTLPMNEMAQVTSVKSLNDVRHVLRALREGDIDAEALNELKDIDLELKRLLIDNDSEAQTADLIREVKALAGELASLAA
jgi:hypothetical protein